MKYIRLICLACVLTLKPASQAFSQRSVTLTIAECRDMAIKASRDLAIQDNKVLQADYDRDFAKASFLPKIDASATGLYVFPDIDMSGNSLQMHGAYVAGISLTQPIYTGGRLLAAKKLTDIGKDAAQQSRRATEMDVIVNTDNAYWTYVAVLSKVSMLKSYVAQLDTIHLQISKAVEVGMSTESQLLRVEARRSDIKYQLQKAENGAVLCRMALCRLVGLDYETDINPVDCEIDVTAPDMLGNSLVNRPEVALLQSQIKAGEQQIRLAKAEYLPTVGLSANYSYHGNFKMKGLYDVGNGTYVPFTQKYEDDLGFLMLSVQIPLINWGQTRSKVRKARLDVENARLQLDNSTRLMTIEVEQAIRNVMDGYTMIETATKGMEQADENLRVMTNRYNASMATLTDMLDAQSQWQQASSNLIEAKAQYKIYQTQYLRATGDLHI